MSCKLLVATGNPGKAREFGDLLASVESDLCFPAEIGLDLNIPEDGVTYLENASQKAISYAERSGLLTLADDSGLEVDALEGAPGLHSARYVAGSDCDRTTALLRNLEGVALECRTARFRCVVVVVSPAGSLWHAEGVCEGVIALARSGSGGFGYDPVFYLPEYKCTMAELSETQKNRISHRARAIQAILPVLEGLTRSWGLA